MKNSEIRESRTGYVFLLIFILLSAGITIGGYFTYQSYEKNYRIEIENQLSAVAELKVNQLVQWRKERLGDGQVFYKNNLFSAIVKRYIQNRNDRDAKAGILTWAGQVQNAYNYDLMMLLDAQWNTVLMYPENKECSRLVIDKKNTEILLSGNMAFQDFYRNDQDQHIYLKILVPILADLPSNRLIAILALRISPEEFLYPFIEKWPAPSRTSETLIIRKDGDYALFVNNLRFHKDAALNLRVPLTNKDVLAVKSILSKEGIVEGIDYRGAKVIGYVRAIPDSPWFLVARMDMEEVYAPLKERLWLMIILVGALLVGAGGSIGLVWRHQRSRFYREHYNSADALRESEAKFRQTFNVSPVGIVMVGFDKKFLRCNNSFSNSLDYLTEELIGKSIEDVTLPEDRSIGMAEMKAIINGETDISQVQKRYLRKNGQVVWGEVAISLVRDSENRPQYFLAIIQDITERKRIEDKLKTSEIMYRRLFEAARDGIIILDAESGMIVDVNPFLVEMLHYSREEFLGRHIWEIGFFKDIAGNKSKFEELQQKEFIQYENLPLETADGRLINVEFVSHVYDVNHTKVIQCNIRDISERKRAEESLRVSEANYRHLFDNAVEGVYQTTPAGKLVSVNKAFVSMFGYESPEEMITTVTDIAHQLYVNPEDRKIPTGILKEKGFLKDYEMKMRRKDGSEIWTSLNARLNKSLLGEIFFEGFISDITKRKRAEEELHESEVKYRELFQNAEVGMYRSRLDGSAILAVNPKLCDLFGYCEEEMLRNPATIRWAHSDARDRMVAELRKSGSLHNYEMDILTSSGDIRSLMISVHLYPDQGYLEGSAFDITERKRVEEALQESERRLSEANKLAQLGNWIWDIKTGRVEWSDEVYNIFQLDRNEFTPQIDSILALSPWPEDHERDKELIRKAMETHEKGNYEQRFLRPDKSTGFYFSTFQGRYDDKGNLIYIVGTVQDITERKRAEAEIKDNEKRFRELIESLPQLFWTCRVDGPCDYLSKQWIEYTGIPKEEQLGYRWLEQLHPDDRDRTVSEWMEKVKTGESFDVEFRIRRNDGVYHWFKTRAVPMHDAEGNMIKWFGSNTDFEDMKKTEEKLLLLSSRQEAILSAVPEIIMEVSNDKVYTWANQSGIDFFGDDVIGKEASFYFEGEQETYKIVQPLFKGDENVIYLESWQRRKDGEKRLLAWWCRVLKDEKGKVTGALSSASDITERKHAEEALAESEKKNRALFETMSEGIVYEDHDGKIISANPAAERFLGLSLDQMQGRTSLDPRWKAIHADGSPFPGETHSLHVAAKTGKPATGEVMGIYNPKADAYVWLSVNSTPEFLPGEKKPFRAYAVFSDITKRKQAEDEIIKLNAELERRVLQRTAQLEAVNKELEAFSYSVSHDLRAPLRHVSGYVDLLGKQNKTDLSEKGQHYLNEITDSTHQMGVLIDDLLNFSRSGRREMHESTLDMNLIVEKVLEQMRQDNSQRDIEWSVAHLPSVHGDDAMMHLVWENLLSNAVKFTRTRKKARIEIGVREEGKEFVFIVRDNGVGFDMQYAQKLFDVFQRLHSTAEFEGTGIGLANVKRIILRHGGRTWAEAELDKGATFYFSLPK